MPISNDDNTVVSAPVYNVLHSDSTYLDTIDNQHDLPDAADDDNEHESSSNQHKKHDHKVEVLESFDFQDLESMSWRKVSIISATLI